MDVVLAVVVAVDWMVADALTLLAAMELIVVVVVDVVGFGVACRQLQWKSSTKIIKRAHASNSECFAMRDVRASKDLSRCVDVEATSATLQGRSCSRGHCMRCVECTSR